MSTRPAMSTTTIDSSAPRTISTQTHFSSLLTKTSISPSSTVNIPIMSISEPIPILTTTSPPPTSTLRTDHTPLPLATLTKIDMIFPYFPVSPNPSPTHAFSSPSLPRFPNSTTLHSTSRTHLLAITTFPFPYQLLATILTFISLIETLLTLLSFLHCLRRAASHLRSPSYLAPIISLVFLAVRVGSRGGLEMVWVRVLDNNYGFRVCSGTAYGTTAGKLMWGGNLFTR
ncbi:hypothetical protein BC829DRAFT_133854 [Chytridium lagenaria]|nr:hypothetical protein BC829DRAFT_133854 [Chytridium lagenaria]